MLFFLNKNNKKKKFLLHLSDPVAGRQHCFVVLAPPHSAEKMLLCCEKMALCSPVLVGFFISGAEFCVWFHCVNVFQVWSHFMRAFLIA